MGTTVPEADIVFCLQVATLQAKLQALEEKNQICGKAPISPGSTGNSPWKDEEHLRGGVKGQRANNISGADVFSGSRRHVFQIEYTKLAFEVCHVGSSASLSGFKRGHTDFCGWLASTSQHQKSDPR